MKPAPAIEVEAAYQAELREFDLREIDNPDPRALHRLKYLARLSGVLAAIRARVPAGALVAEVGCSQANLSLLLAEAGYRAVVLDLRPEALDYARRKHETGRFLPVAGNAAVLPLRAGSCHAVVLGELLEHCADPGRILDEAGRVLRPGGLLIVTTPNHLHQRGDLLSYTEFASQRDGGSGLHRPRASRWPELVEGRTAVQFGPHGDHHLFGFGAAELRRLLTDHGWSGVQVRLVGSPLMSDRLGWLKRLLPVSALNCLSAVLCALPLLGPRLGYTLLTTAFKPEPGD